MKKLSKYAWILTSVLTIIYILGAFANGIDWLITGIVFATLTVYLLLRKTNGKTNTQSNTIERNNHASDISHLRNINVKSDQSIINNTAEEIPTKTSLSNKLFDFITLDFETANNKLDSACSVGIVAVKGNKIVDEYYTLLNPEDDFSSVNIGIHGIRQKDVLNAPLFIDAYDIIKKYISSANYVVAHNAQFDMSVLHYLSNKYSFQVDNFNYLDSIKLTSFQSNGVGKSLQAKVDYFGVQNETAHNALSDAKATAQIVIESINRSRYKSIQTYVKGYSSIPVNYFSDLKPSPAFFKTSRYGEQVKISELKACENAQVDENHILFGKSVVLTGDFSNYSKREIMQKITDIGGIVKSGVSSKTDFLIVGKQDKSIVGEDGLSGKQEKAYELIEKGIEIKILGENDLVHLLG